MKGTLGCAKDTEIGMKWLLASAKQGHAKSQHALGVIYEDGTWGVKQDFKQAVAWYRKSATKEFANAQYNLALCWMNGIGVEKNEKKVCVAFDFPHVRITKAAPKQPPKRACTMHQAETSAHPSRYSSFSRWMNGLSCFKILVC
jgi:TPR repeat protein